MSLRPLAWLCAGLMLCAAGQAQATSARSAGWTPERVAAAVELQASHTSFSALERFGHEAVSSSRPDRLDRLEHVAWLVLNQSDFGRFGYWNAMLRAQALRAGSTRYVQIADLDALRSRYDQGDLAAEDAVRIAAQTRSDWFVRVHAMVLEAYMLTGSGQPAQALRLLADADELAVNARDASARAGVWEIEGLALVKLQDLDGSAMAFGRSQFEFGRPDYPRPDYDGIWDMAGLAAKVGRQELAQALYAADHRLSLSSGLPAELAWDEDLCAAIAYARDTPADVLSCLQPLGPDLKDARYLAHLVLPSRAIAYARTGRLAAARRDLATLERLKASKALGADAVERIPEVISEILHAEGKDGQAFESLRSYSRAHEVSQASAFSLGVGQLTSEMAKQMNVRQLQLATAQNNLALAHNLMRYQRLMGTIGGVIAFAVLALLLWQIKVARELRAARAEAEAGSRAKGEFLANMSHEIRTPLNGLLTMAELMERGVLREEQRKRLSILRQSGRDLLRLLNDILDFSKIEAGKLELEAIVFDPEEVLESTMAGFAAAAEQKNLQLWFEIEPTARGSRLGDPSRLRQIVANFVSNALKFTASGGVQVSVSGFGQDGRDGLTVAVKDTGVGIPAEKMALLFQKFSQLDASTTRRFGGTGLGLAICRELVELMGGRVWAQSVEGEGSTFFATLRLPAVETAVEPDEAAPTGDAPVTAAWSPRLLAAEDNPTNQIVLSTIMQMFGFELTLVGDGVQALDAWRRQEFDVILMDVQMPVMDGIEATRAIRTAEAAEQRRRTPIIALSANAFPHQVQEYLAAGMDGHVSKPIDLSALQAALEGACAPTDDAVLHAAA